MTIWIGTSGWIYPHWVGRFYPAALAPQEYLPYYARHFATVEINSSFYHLPPRSQFALWAEQVAFHPRFRFAVKASRYLTHMKKLRDAAEPQARLLEAARGLGPRLGPLLYQLPPHWRCDLERLATFLHLLPPGLEVAFEFRDPSWLQGAAAERLCALLAEAGCALVIAVGGALSTPLELPATAPFRYLRLHGGQAGPCFDEAELTFWAAWLASEAREGRECYVYFNNDVEGYAVQNAVRLRELVAARLDAAAVAS
uniref:Histidine kinase n=1 Tax=Thermogemmatispora argillosa TaxID=2045280 RepID=A0A455T6V6_9CHLR|nr:histidine kinase [Thermogemmatispora argillosa]